MLIQAGRIRIVDILRDRNNWRRYLAWQNRAGTPVRAAVRAAVTKALACRTPVLGLGAYRCERCGEIHLIPHSCKSSFCASCGTARAKEWGAKVLTDMLDVAYRHLIFTIPFQLRPLIEDNRKRMNALMFRAVRDTLLSLTKGDPLPLGRTARARMKRARKRFLPGFYTAEHTFGSDIKWNPHWHVLITAGGLSTDGTRWIRSSSRSLVSAVELATEWKLRVLKYVARAHKRAPFFCRRLKKDRRRRVDVEKMLGFIRRFKWRVRIGEASENPEGALRYCGRYTRRPALGEARILKYDGKNVRFLYKDYYKGGRMAVFTCGVLAFIHRLTRHIPERGEHLCRAYGLFSSRSRTRLLRKARLALGQRRRRRRGHGGWAWRQRELGNRDPMRCPVCGGAMRFLENRFGKLEVLLRLAGCRANEQIPRGRHLSGAEYSACG